MLDLRAECQFCLPIVNSAKVDQSVRVAPPELSLDFYVDDRYNDALLDMPTSLQTQK